MMTRAEAEKAGWEFIADTPHDPSTLLGVGAYTLNGNAARREFARVSAARPSAFRAIKSRGHASTSQCGDSIDELLVRIDSWERSLASRKPADPSDLHAGVVRAGGHLTKDPPNEPVLVTVVYPTERQA